MRRWYGKFRIALTLLPFAAAAAGAPGITSAAVDRFSAEGTTLEVLQKFVASGAFKGVLGFENLGPAKQVSLFNAGPNVGAVLSAITIQDTRYRVVEGQSPDLVEILAVDATAPGHEILDHRVASFDLEADDWPANIITRLDWYSRDLNEYLTRRFAAGGGQTPTGGSAGSILSGNVTPPHFSIHLKNASVRDILNAASLATLQMHSQALRESPSVRPMVSPLSWEFRFRSAAGLSYSEWIGEIFRWLN
jgi:hypothetical protein